LLPQASSPAPRSGPLIDTGGCARPGQRPGRRRPRRASGSGRRPRRPGRRAPDAGRLRHRGLRPGHRRAAIMRHAAGSPPPSCGATSRKARSRLTTQLRSSGCRRSVRTVVRPSTVSLPTGHRHESPTGRPAARATAAHLMAEAHAATLLRKRAHARRCRRGPYRS
jgi:hypothetical protein